MKRGDIYYVFMNAENTTGCEMQSGRPGVVVSNDKCNSSSGVIEIVYLTTKTKPELPTHVTITSTPKESTALCEQIHSISTTRIGDYMCTLSENEMQSIDAALHISIGLTEKPSVNSSEELIRTKAERDLYEKLLNKFMMKGGN